MSFVYGLNHCKPPYKRLHAALSKLLTFTSTNNLSGNVLRRKVVELVLNVVLGNPPLHAGCSRSEQE